MPQLYLSAGHQGGEIGTKGPAGQREEVITRAIVDLAAERGFKTVPHDKLAARVAWINKNCKPDDVVIDLHLDSPDSSQQMDCGIYFYGGSESSQKLAEKIIGSYAKSMDGIKYWIRPDTSSRFGRLGFVRDTKPLAFILELADIDLPKDGIAAFNSRVLSAFGAIKELVEGGKDLPSPWAAEAWEKVMGSEDLKLQALRLQLMRFKPDSLLTVDDVTKFLSSLGALQKVEPLTAERLMVALDRLGIL